MEVGQVLAQLVAARRRPEAVGAPSTPGVYAIFLRRQGTLASIVPSVDGIVYIGRSSNLAQRELGTHFQTGQSGFSTVRRSLGAMLLDELDLKPRPRGNGASENNYLCYRFDDAGEQRLSDWMHENLDLAVHSVANPGQLERELVVTAQPPLNLTHWSNPDAASIKAARKACVAAARMA
jgi:hypothetical protein